MALVVEDGTGVSGANSYATVAEVVADALDRGVTVTEAKAEINARAAMRRMQGLDYLGTPVSRDQPLDFPREDVCIDGFTYASTELPKFLKLAQLEYAFAANSIELEKVQAAGAAGQMIEDTIGPITKRYAEGKYANREQATVPAADKLLQKLLRGTSGAVKVVRA